MKKIERTLIPIVSVLLVLILIAAGALRWLDRWAQDALYQRRSLPSSDLVIIGIDDRTLDTLGPWPDGTSTGQDYRTYMGIALSVLASDPEHMPAAVAVDVLYEGSGARASSDRMLAMGWHYFEAARERRALALEKQRIDTELSLATRIQANSLPKRLPERPSFDLSASMTPAREVGGDLYDFFFIDDDHLCLVIGDVSGKGVPASLFMMMTSTLIHYVAGRERSPAKILTAVNAEICSRNPEEMFITVWLGVLELSTGILTAANAGHEYPALRRPDGRFELFKDRHGFVIGGMEGVRYREYTLPLSPGTKLFVYTDGVPEATDAREEMFGTDRMLDALRTHEQEAPEAILAGVSGAVSAFVGAAPQFDDLTMLCLAWNGGEPSG